MPKMKCLTSENRCNSPYYMNKEENHTITSIDAKTSEEKKFNIIRKFSTLRTEVNLI